MLGPGGGSMKGEHHRAGPISILEAKARAAWEAVVRECEDRLRAESVKLGEGEESRACKLRPSGGVKAQG